MPVVRIPRVSATHNKRGESELRKRYAQIYFLLLPVRGEKGGEEHSILALGERRSEIPLGKPSAGAGLGLDAPSAGAGTSGSQGSAPTVSMDRAKSRTRI